MKIFKKTLAILAMSICFMIMSGLSTSHAGDFRFYQNPGTNTSGGNQTAAGAGGNQTIPGAGGGRTNAGGSKFKNPIKATNLYALLADFLKVITMLGAIVVVIFFILAGFKYVTARGDEGKIGEATRALTWTAVGAAVLLGAQVLARVIQNTVSQLG